MERLLDLRRLSGAEVARQLGVSKQTFFNWLDKPESCRKVNGWDKISDILQYDREALLDESQEVDEATTPQLYSRRMPVNVALVDMLVDILEDPTAEPKRKDVARLTIREWFATYNGSSRN